MRDIHLINGAVAIVDDDDFVRLSAFRWRADRGGYAVRMAHLGIDRKGRLVAMHRVVAAAAPGDIVDHINGNRLDNRRSNLRLSTHAGNSQNRRATGASGFKGVTLHRQTGKWQAAIKPGGRNIHLGLFTDPVIAARSYDRAATEHYGDSARLNFPEAA